MNETDHEIEREQGDDTKQDGHSSDQLYNNKSRTRASAEARVDPTYGQRSALPGLDSEEPTTSWDDDDGISLEALRYLKSVRQEATSIPNLLVAPRDPTNAYNQYHYDDDFDNTGYYENGTYYTSDIVPAATDAAQGDGGTEIDPQLAYFDSILSRFKTLRAQLQRTPPPDAIMKLDHTHPITPPLKSKKNHTVAKWWRGQIQTMNPVPAQVASMDKSTVLEALGSLTGGKLLKSGASIKRSVSLWIWALLAKLPERGELSSVEIGIVRDLGKRSVLVGIGLHEENDWKEGMQQVEAGLDEDEEEDYGSYIANDEEIQLDTDEYLDPENDTSLQTSNTALQIGPQLPTDLGNAMPDKTSRDESKHEPSTTNHRQPSSSTAEEKLETSDELQQASDEAQFNAAKARMLANLRSDPMELDVNLEPEIDVPQEKAEDVQESKSNTRATVDMIITVAGEMYGQRDLLEFRPTWGE